MNHSELKKILSGCVLAATLCSLISVAGCGGGGSTGLAGGGTSAGGGGGTSTPNVNATATFHVDVKTGKVTITPRNGGNAKAEKAFRGSAIGFASSVLLDQLGSNGRKVVSVSITNNAGEPIGSPASGGYSGINLLFSTFTNVAAFSSLEPKTTVSTFAGTGAAGPTDGSTASARFNFPRGLTVASDGTIFVADFGNNKIRRISHGVVSTLAGSGVAGEKDGLGANATFNGPSGITVVNSYDPLQYIVFVCDATGNKIRRVTMDGRVNTVAGTGFAGTNDAYGDTATFTHPNGITTDGGSNLFISEDSNKIRQIYGGSYNTNPTYYTVTTLAGSGAAGSTDGVGPAATFSAPRGLTWDTTTKCLYVADYGSNKIRRVTDLGEVVTIAGTGGAGGTDGLGSGATFSNPIGITMINGALYVSEYSGKRIRQLTLTPGGNVSHSGSWNVAALAGTGAAGNNNGTGDVATFSAPYYLGVDSGSNLYVADFSGDQIRKVRPSTGFLPIGLPTGAAPAEPVQLFNPDGIIPNSGYGANMPFINYAYSLNPGSSTSTKDWVFIVPPGVTAFEFSVTVEANTIYGAPPEAGTGAGSPNVDVRTISGNKLGFIDGTLTEARFGSSASVATDASGNLFVADTTNHALRRISTSGLAHTIAGGNGPGSADGTGLQAQFRLPSGIAVTADGTTIYMADTGNHVIRRITYAAANSNDPANWTVTTIAGTGAAGKTDGTGQVASFNAPYGIAISPGGILYVSEKLGNRVRRLQLSGGDASVNTNWRTTTLAGDTAAVAGAPGSTNAAGTAARFNNPLGIGVDRSGNVFVADSANDTVRQITLDGSVSTLAGTPGAASYVDALGAAGRFSGPTGIAVDSSGYVYVADAQNNRVRRVSPKGDVKTVAGTGIAGAVNGPGNLATFATPTGITVDGAGTVYVTDYTLGSVRMVQRVLTGL